MSTPDQGREPDKAPADDAPHSPATHAAQRPVPAPPTEPAPQPTAQTPPPPPEAPLGTRPTGTPEPSAAPAAAGSSPMVTRTSVRPGASGPGSATTPAGSSPGSGSTAPLPGYATATVGAAPAAPVPAASGAAPTEGPPTVVSPPVPDPQPVHPAEPDGVPAPAPEPEPAASRRGLRRHDTSEEVTPSGSADSGRSTGGVLRHLLGVVVGLVATVVATWLVVFGQSRILSAQAPQWSATFEPLGVVLVTFGALLLAATLALGLWTPAVPIAGGLGAALVGVVYLYSPATMHAHTLDWFATESTRGSVVRATVATTSGTVFVIGILLLAAGLVQLAAARRQVRGA